MLKPSFFPFVMIIILGKCSRTKNKVIAIDNKKKDEIYFKVNVIRKI